MFQKKQAPGFITPNTEDRCGRCGHLAFRHNSSFTRCKDRIIRLPDGRILGEMPLGMARLPSGSLPMKCECPGWTSS